MEVKIPGNTSLGWVGLQRSLIHQLGMGGSTEVFDPWLTEHLGV